MKDGAMMSATVAEATRSDSATVGHETQRAASRIETGAGALSAAEVAACRADFPILSEKNARGLPIAYLDNAATTQKPRSVLDTLAHYYEHDNANVHRGVHLLAERATTAYEASRKRIARFINAASEREIIFVRGATEGINLVAASLGRILKPGDEVIVSTMEHHANIVPWQFLRDQLGVVLKVVPIDERGVMDLDALDGLLTERTRLVSIGHVSNALGTINPVRRVIDTAHAAGAAVLLDGAQAIPHMDVDVQALDCDFYVFSGHKMFGPTGIGILYGKEAWLERLPPYQGGGDMIEHVSFERTTFNELPYKFEAGTPHVAGAIGLAAAADYLDGVGRGRIAAYEQRLLDHAHRRLAEIPGLRIIGQAAEKAAVVSFVLDDVHAYDMGVILDQQGIAVRTGHHCAMPVMEYFGLPATTRASMAFYNTTDEIDRLADALTMARTLLA